MGSKSPDERLSGLGARVVLLSRYVPAPGAKLGQVGPILGCGILSAASSAAAKLKAFSCLS